MRTTTNRMSAAVAVEVQRPRCHPDRQHLPAAPLLDVVSSYASRRQLGLLALFGDDESAPDWFVLEFCDQAVRRFREELAGVDGRDQLGEEQAQLRVVDALAGEFQQSAGSRDWTLADRRVRQLAGDAIGLSLEFQHDHGYEPMGARWAAVRECVEGEQAREVIAEHQREVAAEAASQGQRTTAEAEAARVDRGQPTTRGGGER